MPNKTIYIKDSDVRIWDRAQRELGESVSSVFVDYLKDRLEMEAARKSARKAGRVDEIQVINALLAEINAALDLDLELHPFWKYPILNQNSLNHGYKVHQKKANPDRIMSLVVWPLDFNNSAEFNLVTRERIWTAVQKFWDGKTIETHTFVNATK